MPSLKKMIILNDSNFDQEVLKSALPVMVDFWAPWCGPCQMAEPVIEKLATEYEGKVRIGKLNVDENPQIAPKFGIMSIPTVITFKGGKEIRREIGFVGQTGYEKMIKEILG